ncbi:MAG: ABC transporter permease [Chloroflexi bacterium]|nr:ABC transporter permease [Chloroflexota bacterium]
MNSQDNRSNVFERRVLNEINSLVKYRYLIGELIMRNIKTRYKRSLLGVAWTMVNPLLTMLVMTIVFSQLFAFDLPHYPVYLLTGLLLWNFFSETTVSATRNLIWSSNLLKRIYIPKSLFATAAVGTSLVNLLLALVPLGIIIFITGSKIGPALLFLPAALLLVSAFSLGVGLAVSAQAVFFTDVVDMYQILLVAWMYLTPIFYPQNILPDEFQWIININPMYYILECFRSPLYLNQIPEPHIILGAVVSALTALFLGGFLFTRKSDDFAYYL